MQIIPVIDISNGMAVRAVAGERKHYRAIQSRLTESVEPAEVMRAIQERLQCPVCYVADLDAIERQQLNRCTIAEMVRTGVALIVDAGTETFENVETLLEMGVRQVVLSSESMPDLGQLETFAKQYDSESLIFSIDLKHGQLLVSDPAWQGKSPIDMARCDRMRFSSTHRSGSGGSGNRTRYSDSAVVSGYQTPIAGCQDHFRWWR